MKKIIIIIIITLFSFINMFAYELDFDYNNAKLIKEDGNKKIYSKPDGTQIEKYDDKEIAILKNKTMIIKFKNGKREIQTSDGVKIFVDYDGTAEYNYPNGKKKIVSIDGRTHYGLNIDEKIEKAKRKEFVVEIVYSKMLSDDNMDKFILRFYKELVNQVQNKIYKIKVPQYKLRIEISNCKYCKTGYCRRKNKKEIIITSYKDDIVDKIITLNHNDLKDKNKYVNLVKETVNSFFSE